MGKSDQLLKHVKRKMFESRPNKIMEKLNEKSKAATDRFNKNEDIARFLQDITYDDDIQSASQQCHLYEDDDEDDEFDDNEVVDIELIRLVILVCDIHNGTNQSQ